MVIRANGRPTAAEVLVELADHDMPTHNGQMLDSGRVALNDSTTNTLRVYSAESGDELAAVKIPGSWLRGMEPIGDDRVFVGTAPATIVLAHAGTGEMLGRLQLSENTNEAIHGLAFCPPPNERR
jgi:hypothetical protein